MTPQQGYKEPNSTELTQNSSINLQHEKIHTLYSTNRIIIQYNNLLYVTKSI